MSAVFHPQTDGRAERVNQIIGAYLRPFLNHDQDDWVNLLPLAECAYNNSSTTARVYPLYANYGWHPSANNPRQADVLHLASEAHPQWIRGAIDQAREVLEEPRTGMVRFADPK